MAQAFTKIGLILSAPPGASVATRCWTAAGRDNYLRGTLLLFGKIQDCKIWFRNDTIIFAVHHGGNTLV